MQGAPTEEFACNSEVSVLVRRLRVIEAASQNVRRLDRGAATVHELVHRHAVCEETNLGGTDQTWSLIIICIEHGKIDPSHREVLSSLGHNMANSI